MRETSLFGLNRLFPRIFVLSWELQPSTLANKQKDQRNGKENKQTECHKKCGKNYEEGEAEVAGAGAGTGAGAAERSAKETGASEEGGDLLNQDPILLNTENAEVEEEE